MWCCTKIDKYEVCAPSPSLLHTQSLRADNKDQGLQPGWMRIWGVGGSPPKTTNRQKLPALLPHLSIGALQQIVNNLISFSSSMDINS